LNKSNTKQYLALHQEIFPDAYITGLEVIETTSNKRDVHLIKSNDSYVGFSSLRLDSNNIATIEFLGIKEGYRGKGLGKKLLCHQIHYSFNHSNLSELNLVVDSDNENAIRLYKKLGFDVLIVNQSYTL